MILHSPAWRQCRAMLGYSYFGRRQMDIAELHARLDPLTIISPSGCWEWQGRVDKDGYGQIAHEGRTMAIHRLSLEAATGKRPDVTMHRCDNRRCWNPEHLANGTHHSNRADCVSKGRHARAESHFRAKLTWRDVMAIRSLSSNGQDPGDLAQRFGVTPRNIRYIITARTWRTENV